MKRPIAAVRPDPQGERAGDYIADLDCGHPQHVRHRPPFELRPWVLTPEGRAEKIGVELDCAFCDMPALPTTAQVYKRTATFNGDSIPAALRRDHSTRRGTWGRIVIESGTLLYEIAEDAAWVLRPGITGVIAPEQTHRVEPVGPVQFFVEFLRLPKS